VTVKVGQVFTLKAIVRAEFERFRDRCERMGTKLPDLALLTFGNVTITSVDGSRITADSEDGRQLECTVLGLLQDYEEVRP
jgi:hypothetical protein